MDQRNEFIQHVLSGEQRFNALCVHYGISRKTGYKWLDRFRAGGVANLADRSRRPHRMETVGSDMEALILAVRREHPTWGARKIRDYLQNICGIRGLPCVSTIHSRVVAAGLVQARRRGSRLGQVRTTLPPVTGPNQIWPIDYKGDFKLGDRSRCYPLTVTDWQSRYLLICRGYDRICGEQVRSALKEAFQRFGMPQCILSDNGAPFAGPGCGGLSTLSVWLIKLGIDVIRSRPGKPQDNGRHERMHRTLKAETALPPANCLAEQQARFDRFDHTFNHIRPHESLDGFPPAASYTPSERPYREPETPVYPGHWETRQVTASGEFCFKGATYFLSQPLAGEQVGLEEFEDGRWRIAFGQVPVGSIDTRTNTLTRLGAKRLAAKPTAEGSDSVPR